MLRHDMVHPYSEMSTRPRSGSHLDCLALKATCPYTVVQFWSRIWAGDDHTTMGIELTVASISVEEQPAPSDDANSHLRYDYKQCTTSEIEAYRRSLEDYVNAGLRDRLLGHVEESNDDTVVSQSKRQRRLAVNACLLSAAIHKAAGMHLGAHRKKKGQKAHWEEKKVETVVKAHGKDTL
jgi:hypothetical protein